MIITVEVSEVHKSLREVEVPDDASDEQIRELAEAEAGEAEELDLEYSCTLDSSQWTVRKPNGDYV